MRPLGFVCFTIVLKINQGKKKLKVFQLKNNICFKWPHLGFAPSCCYTTFPSLQLGFGNRGWKMAGAEAAKPGGEGRGTLGVSGKAASEN